MNYLHNCPNCGGFLNDAGRCEFCGSKVYDFVNIDFDKGAHTYIRIKSNGKVAIVPIIVNTASISIKQNYANIGTEMFTGTKYSLITDTYAEGSFDFLIAGEIQYESEGES